MWIFEHNFVADKGKIRRRAVARQVFFTQYAAKFAEKTRVYACDESLEQIVSQDEYCYATDSGHNVTCGCKLAE